MALPRVLKDLMIFNAGLAYIGQANSATLPKLARKIEKWRGGGMDSPVPIDMGGADDMDFEFSCGGPMRDVVAQYGIMSMAGVQLRFAGAYQNDVTGRMDSIEITVRGRHEEIDRGEQKVGEMGAFKVKVACSYYKEDWNGRTLVEIDPINGVLIVDGVDRLADRRDALGL